VQSCPQSEFFVGNPCSLWHELWTKNIHEEAIDVKERLCISWVEARYSSNGMNQMFFKMQKNFQCLVYFDVLPSPKLGPRWALVSKTTKLWGLEGTLPALNTKRGRRACWSSGMGLGRGTNFSYLLELASSQPTSWLVCILEHPWC
jgi:hypothetical protein